MIKPEFNKCCFFRVFFKLEIPELCPPFDREWRNGRVKLASHSSRDPTREHMQTSNLDRGKYQLCLKKKVIQLKKRIHGTSGLSLGPPKLQSDSLAIA